MASQLGLALLAVMTGLCAGAPDSCSAVKASCKSGLYPACKPDPAGFFAGLCALPASLRDDQACDSKCSQVKKAYKATGCCNQTTNGRAGASTGLCDAFGGNMSYDKTFYDPHTKLPYELVPQLTALWMDCLNTQELSTLTDPSGQEWLRILPPPICYSWNRTNYEQAAAGSFKWNNSYCWVPEEYSLDTRVDITDSNGKTGQINSYGTRWTVGLGAYRSPDGQAHSRFAAPTASEPVLKVSFKTTRSLRQDNDLLFQLVSSLDLDSEYGYVPNGDPTLIQDAGGTNFYHQAGPPTMNTIGNTDGTRQSPSVYFYLKPLVYGPPGARYAGRTDGRARMYVEDANILDPIVGRDADGRIRTANWGNLLGYNYAAKNPALGYNQSSSPKGQLQVEIYYEMFDAWKTFDAATAAKIDPRIGGKVSLVINGQLLCSNENPSSSNKEPNWYSGARSSCWELDKDSKCRAPMQSYDYNNIELPANVTLGNGTELPLSEFGLYWPDSCSLPISAENQPKAIYPIISAIGDGQGTLIADIKAERGGSKEALGYSAPAQPAACSVINGSSLSSAYPCSCGGSVCTAGQKCNFASSWRDLEVSCRSQAKDRVVAITGGTAITASGLQWIDNQFKSSVNQDDKDAFKAKYTDAGMFISDSDMALVKTTADGNQYFASNFANFTSPAHAITENGLQWIDYQFKASVNQDDKDAFKAKYTEAGMFISDSDMALVKTTADGNQYFASNFASFTSPAYAITEKGLTSINSALKADVAENKKTAFKAKYTEAGMFISDSDMLLVKRNGSFNTNFDTFTSPAYAITENGLTWINSALKDDVAEDEKTAFKAKYTEAGMFISDSDMLLVKRNGSFNTNFDTFTSPA